MTILRRYFDAEPLLQAILATPSDGSADPKILATFDTDTGELIVGWQLVPWDSFSTPLALVAHQDDAPAEEGDRQYSSEGRTYVVGGSDVVADLQRAQQAE